MATFGEFTRDEDKELLLSRVNQLVFVDGVAGFECGRCDRILIRHYVANCSHKYCANCRKVLMVSKSNCPLVHCRKPIENIDAQDIEFERKLFDLRTHCPNKSYGCPFVSKLKDLGGHLRMCRDTRDNALPVLIKGNNVVETALRELGSKFDRLSEDVNKIKDETSKSLKDMETKMENNFKELSKKNEQKMSEWNTKIRKLESFEQTIKELITKQEKNLTETNDRVQKCLIEINNVNVQTEVLLAELKKGEAKLDKVKTEVDKKMAKMIVDANKTKDETNKSLKDTKTEEEKNFKEIKEMNKKMLEWGNKITVLEKTIRENELNERNNSELMKRQFKSELDKVSITYEKKWAETNDKVCRVISKLNEEEKKKVEMASAVKILNTKTENLQVELKNQVTQQIKSKTDVMARTIEETNKKTSQLITKVSNIEEIIQGNQLLIKANKSTLISNLEQKIINLESFNQLKILQMNCFTLAENKGIFQPDFTWKILGIGREKNYYQYEMKSEVFEWPGYSVRSYAKMEVGSYASYLEMSLCLEEHNNGKPIDLKLIPKVYFVLRDQTKTNCPKHICRAKEYEFPLLFNYSLDFKLKIYDNYTTFNIDSAYKVDDSIVIDIYLEPPAMALLVHSTDGTLSWAIEHYSKRKVMETERIVEYHESPYFYTGPKGYRVQVKMWLKEGLRAEIKFLTGEFDADLSWPFLHQTTISLVSQKFFQRNITKTENNNIQNKKNSYSIYVCSSEEIENILTNDVLLYKVTIKPLN